MTRKRKLSDESPEGGDAMRQRSAYQHKALLLALSVLLLPLGGCQPAVQDNTVRTHPFSLRDVVKSDTDKILELQLRNSTRLLKQLMKKLYLRNPKYWRSAGFQTADNAVDWAFASRHREAVLRKCLQKKSIDSLQLAFDETYQGDRVLAFVYGLYGMLNDAYDNKTEFFLLDDLDPQRIYNATRNIEVAAWKLSHDRDTQHQLFLVSNALSGPVINLSFERLFGKLVAIHDGNAEFIADKTNRRINYVIQGVVRFVFLPI
ncbi:MAG: hypothetical protein KDI74_16425 [Gammaproteobacteria bacterium]|nr:hypothetical protein [Gammaproteobacteria bacterium]HXK55684.1 hypothetical protein [Gammaproteobacteria bacterium]